MLGDKRFIQTIRLRNLLSFGPESEEIELKSLNVLIGPNASGKSNFIEAINILRNTPNDIVKPIREGGGINEWFWKGKASNQNAQLAVSIDFPISKTNIFHKLCFTTIGQKHDLNDEVIENAYPSKKDALRYVYHQAGQIILLVPDITKSENIEPGTKKGRFHRLYNKEDLNTQQSILAQRKDPDQYPEITYIGNQYSKIKLYKDWELGKYSATRRPQATDLLGDFLEDGTTGEVANNLALVVNVLQNKSDCWEPILERFKNFYPLTENITARVIVNTVLLMLHEKGLMEPIPATRWSDGMLRYLALLAILCHPDPPPLICLEEPELGMHPDILSDIAELLIEASHRTQLIVTTHSDILVSALTEAPESVLVCERDKQGTSMRRLQKEKLEEWLKKYSLGELWRMGELGGNRW